MLRYQGERREFEIERDLSSSPSIITQEIRLNSLNAGVLQLKVTSTTQIGELLSSLQREEAKIQNKYVDFTMTPPSRIALSYNKEELDKNMTIAAYDFKRDASLQQILKPFKKEDFMTNMRTLDEFLFHLILEPKLLKISILSDVNERILKIKSNFPHYFQSKRTHDDNSEENEEENDCNQSSSSNKKRKVKDEEVRVKINNQKLVKLEESFKVMEEGEEWEAQSEGEKRMKRAQMIWEFLVMMISSPRNELLNDVKASIIIRNHSKLGTSQQERKTIRSYCNHVYNLFNNNNNNAQNNSFTINYLKKVQKSINHIVRLLISYFYSELPEEKPIVVPTISELMIDRPNFLRIMRSEYPYLNYILRSKNYHTTNNNDDDGNNDENILCDINYIGYSYSEEDESDLRLSYLASLLCNVLKYLNE